MFREPQILNGARPLHSETANSIFSTEPSWAVLQLLRHFFLHGNIWRPRAKVRDSRGQSESGVSRQRSTTDNPKIGFSDHVARNPMRNPPFQISFRQKSSGM